MSRAVGFAAVATGYFSFACTTTLDPTVVVTGTDSNPGPGLQSCPVFQEGNRVYTVCAEPLAYAAAAHDCNLRGASLAVIESEPENNLVAGYAAEVVGSNVWLGATRDDELVWTWENGQAFWSGGADGSAESGAYVRWAPGEPNDSSTVSEDPERCLALTLAGPDWNDRVCSLALAYVCERAAD